MLENNRHSKNIKKKNQSEKSEEIDIDFSDDVKRFCKEYTWAKKVISETKVVKENDIEPLALMFMFKDTVDEATAQLCLIDDNIESLSLNISQELTSLKETIRNN